MIAGAVAVTPRSFRAVEGQHLRRLADEGIEVRFPEVERPLDEGEMVELVRGCWGLIVGVDPVTPRVLDTGPLRTVVKYGSGTDNIDLAAAARRGVRVVATPGANARSVAELTIGLVLALARHVVAHDRSVRRGSWERRTGIELAGRRLGIVGYGAVGREVGAIARALGMTVIVHDPYVEETDVALVDLDKLLEQADVVSLHVPLTEETRHLIGPRQLARMRRGALLLNTCRGAVVDEDALAAALRDGQLGGAAVDTFEHEPPGDSPLLEIDTFVASPHVGAATVDAVRRTGLAAVRELLASAPAEGEA
ncbi:MAG: phosphoglycerate dehydrogenase [Acidimicrobiales bacterium]